MTRFNLNQKRFRPVSNSKKGEVNEATSFDYTEYNGIIRATYQGGTIQSGHILAQWQNENRMSMLYHCLTKDNELKAGKAMAVLRKDADGLIEMDLTWEWLGNNGEKGQSKYKEISRSTVL